MEASSCADSAAVSRVARAAGRGERAGAFRADELGRRVDKERGIEIPLVYQRSSARANVFSTPATRLEFHARASGLREEPGVPQAQPSVYVASE